MEHDTSDGKIKDSTLRVIIGISLMFPWVIGDFVLREINPSLSYSFGMFIGVMSGSLFYPQRLNYWYMALIAALLALSHFFFVQHFPCWGLSR